MEIFEPWCEFGQNVVDARQVLLGCFQAVEGGGPLVLITSDSSRFFKERAPLFRRQVKDTVDQPLPNHRVGAFGQAGVGEQVGDIL